MARPDLPQKTRKYLRMINYWCCLAGAFLTLIAGIAAVFLNSPYALACFAMSAWLFRLMHLAAIGDTNPIPPSPFWSLFKRRDP